VDILEKMMGIMIGAITVGALVGKTLSSLTNMTGYTYFDIGLNETVVVNSTIPTGLSNFYIFFSLVIPLVIIFGIVKYFKSQAD